MLPISDTVPRRSPPVMTWLLIVLNVIVFLLELTLPPYDLERMFYLFGIVPARYAYPSWAAWVGLPVNDYWPFLTSMFLHSGWLHIIVNMWTLWIFGGKVEDRMGPVRFLWFYFLCGIAAGIVHSLASPDSMVPAVGASGAIAGVLGSYFVLFPYARIVVLVPVFIFPFFFELPAAFYLGFWILTQVFSGTLALASPQQVGGVAWWAHVGGFTAGILLQFLFVKRGGPYRRPARDEYGVRNAWIPDSYWRHNR